METMSGWTIAIGHRAGRHHHQRERHQHLDPGEVEESAGGEHQRHHDDRPEQPAHPVALDAAGAAVAYDDARHRHQERRDRETREHRERGSEGVRRHREAGQVEVDAGRHRGVVRAVAGRGDDHRQAGQRHQREAHLAGHAPAAGQEAAGREDQQQHRDRHRQERREPEQEPQREAHPGERPVRGEADAHVGLGQPVERPEEPEPGQRPAEPVVGVAAQDHDREPGEDHAVQGVDPAGLRGELETGVAVRRAEVEGDRAGEADERTARAAHEDRRSSAGAVRSSPRHCDAPGGRRSDTGPRPVVGRAGRPGGAGPGELTRGRPGRPCRRTRTRGR